MDNTFIWIIVGPILAALIGAVVGGFVRDWWVERFYRPKLYILYESVTQGISYSHHRILIRNRGKRAAENCIGKITIYAIADDVYEPKFDYQGIRNIEEPKPILTKNYFAPIEDMSLCWSRLDNPESCTINRNTVEPLELCEVFENELRIPSERGWQNWRISLKTNKEYHGKIEVTSANADPASASFKLVPEGGDVKLIVTERKPSYKEHK